MDKYLRIHIPFNLIIKAFAIPFKNKLSNLKIDKPQVKQDKFYCICSNVQVEIFAI